MAKTTADGKAGTTQKRSGAKVQSKRHPQKTMTVKKTAAYNNTRKSPEQIKMNNQRKSVLLFTLAIFFGCLIMIKGDSLWQWSHNLLLGLFGGWAILGPFLMLYIAVVTAMNKQQSSMRMKIWVSFAIIVLCCATGYIFGNKTPEPPLGIFELIGYLYTGNTGVGGGVIGGILGTPILAAAGDIGARIIVALLLFVTVMILTGTTLIQLFTTLNRPVKAVSGGIQNVKKNRKGDRQEEVIEDKGSKKPAKKTDEDILPQHPVRSAPYFFDMDEEEEIPDTVQGNEKLKKLKDIFGFREETTETADSPMDYPENPGILNEEFEEIANMQFPGMQTGNSEPDGRNNKSRKRTKSAAIDSEAAQDAEKATKEFLERQAENLKQETASGGQSQNNIGEQRSAYAFPPVTMLETGKRVNPALETEELQTNGRILVETLKSFGVQSKILDICRGPAVTRYELQPAAGVKISKITNLSDDLAMNLAAIGVRIEAPIPGKAAIGIEVPNKVKTIVRMRELVESNAFVTAKSNLTVALGRDIAGQVIAADLAKMPHVLIAGTTGSGKSVCINSLIVSTLYKATPEQVRFLMIDPKVVELGIYNGIPHLLVPVVTDPRKAAGALGWAVNEMLNRYKVFADHNVRDLVGYNHYARSTKHKGEDGLPLHEMPQIIIIIDELSDLMMAAPNEVEDAICRLAQMARAAGMHLVVATQRPSVDVVTGLIKANIPSRIAFAVSSTVDSRTILDGGGAEKLLGQGDMLFSPVGASKPLRVQGCFVSDSEIESITAFVKNSRSMEYDEEVIEEIEKNALPEKAKTEMPEDESRDEMLEEAIKCVVEMGQASTSMLQRRLRVGYARAGRLVDEMEQMGIVGPHEGSKPRQVLISHGQWLERNINIQE